MRRRNAVLFRQVIQVGMPSSLIPESLFTPFVLDSPLVEDTIPPPYYPL